MTPAVLSGLPRTGNVPPGPPGAERQGGSGPGADVGIELLSHIQVTDRNGQEIRSRRGLAQNPPFILIGVLE